MPKVLYLIDRYYPNDDALIEELHTKFLPDRGYRVTIVARTREFKAIKTIKWNESDLILIPSQVKYITEFRHINKLLKIINAEWDVVQVRNDPIYALLALKKGLVFQLTHLKAEEFINDTIKSPLSFIKGSIDLLLRPFILRKANFVISMSESMTRYLQERYKVTNVFDLPMGVDIISVDEKKVIEIRKQYDLSTKIVFIYVGTMTKVRRLDVLLRAYKNIETRNTALMMLGDAPDPQDVIWLKRISQNLRIRNIFYIERVPRADVPNYICAANIGLAVTPLTTANRCMSPTKTLEYLNCGIPVLATNIPDQAMLIKKSRSGIICEFSEKDISAKMKHMVKHKNELKKMAASGKEYVRKNRNYYSIGQKLISYYHEYSKL